MMIAHIHKCGSVEQRKLAFVMATAKLLNFSTYLDQILVVPKFQEHRCTADLGAELGPST